MKAIVDAKEFSMALDKVSTVLKRSHVPVLETVSLRFDGTRCVMTATDLYSWLVAEIPAQGDTFTCGFYRHKEAVKTCRFYEGQLTLEALERGNKQGYIRLTCDSRTAELDGFPLDELFPEAPSKQAQASFFVNAASLLARINRVKYAVLKSGSEIQAKQTCVQFKDNSVFCLDGSRAACDTDPTLTIPKEFLTNGSALAHLKLFGDSEVEAHICVGHIHFAGEGLSLYCTREGVETFKLDQAVPQSFRDEFYVQPKEFLKELDYLKGILSPKEKPYIRFQHGKLSLDSAYRRGQTAVSIAGSSSIDFGFDLNFMSDALKQFEKEPHVRIKVSGQLSPLIIEAEGRNDYALLMPVRLKQSRMAA